MQDQENEEMILMMMMMMFMFIGVGLLIYFMFREKDCSDIDSDDDDYVVGALTYKNDEDDKQKCVPKTCGTGYDTLPVNGSCVVSSTPSYETETETETEDEEKDCDDIDSDDDDYVVGALTYKIDPDNESNCIPEVCGTGYDRNPVNGSCVVASTPSITPSDETEVKNCAELELGDDEYVVGALRYEKDSDNKCIPVMCKSTYERIPVDGSCVRTPETIDAGMSGASLTPEEREERTEQEREARSWSGTGGLGTRRG